MKSKFITNSAIGIFLLVFPLLFGTELFAQRTLGVRPTNSGGVPTYEQAAYDVQYYDISIEVFPKEKSISGNVVVGAKIVQPLNVIVLDLDEPFSVSRVELLVGESNVNDDSKLNKATQFTPLKFERTPTQLFAYLPKTYQPGEDVSISIKYEGTPRVAPHPPWIGGFMWEKTGDGSDWIATAVQNDGADLMFPVKDIPSDKAEKVLMHVTVPENLYAALPGTLKTVVSNQNKTKTYNWVRSEPIPNYEIVLNIAPYKIVKDSMKSVAGDEIPIVFYVLPEHENKARQLINDTKTYVKFFEKYLGPYPFRSEKLGIAETPHLGMEHSTIIAYGNNFKYNKNGVDTLMFHELGHEWWANLVTASDWRDFWIHEGFQSFMDTLYVEELKGREAYLAEMKQRARATKNNQPIAPRDHKYTYQVYMAAPDYKNSDGDIYGKGAVVLHTLRNLIGDDAFFRALRLMAYPQKSLEAKTDGSQVRFVNTDDFVTIAENESGMKLDWFFEVYARRAALPILKYEQVEGTTGKSVNFTWEAPDSLPFNMPIDVYVNGKVKRIKFTNNVGVMPIQTGEEFQIDPEGLVLKNLINLNKNNRQLNIVH
ncbi:MAG: M1 family metallopeptidase [Pyrinomonadaceae bacterium]